MELETVFKKGGKSNQYLGYCFEQIAHWMLRDDSSFKICSLDSQAEYIYDTFHQKGILTFSEIDMIKKYKYYQPINENFPSFDAIFTPKAVSK
jgi:hypothetical protein